MQEIFIKLRDNYLVAKQYPCADHTLYMYFRDRSYLKSFVDTGVIDLKKYSVKGSVGIGVWASIPWLGIFDDEISVSAAKGYDIVYLFSFDMKKVYLSLNQGWTYFKEKYGVARGKKYIEQISKLWQQKLHSSLNDFSFEPINLEYNGKGTQLPVGYERGHICGKCYDLYNLPSEDVLKIDLQNMLAVFRELKGYMINNSVEETNNHLLSIIATQPQINRSLVNNKIKSIKNEETLDSNNSNIRILEKIIAEEGENTVLNILSDLPKLAHQKISDNFVHGIDMSTSNTKNESKSSGSRKTDYKAKQELTALIGRAGEYMVLKYENKRLSNLRIDKEAKLVALYDDSVGYDILSYDAHGNEIYIEVKTTSGGIDEPFYISINEARCSINNPEKYYIYRIYNFNYQQRTGKIYIQKGDVFNNFELEANSYVFRGLKDKEKCCFVTTAGNE